MSNVVSKKHFVCADLEKNSYKFWIGELYDNGLVRLRYGRVGSNEQVTEKQFNNQYEAQKFFDGKVKDKQKVKSRRDAYTEINVIEETGSITKTVGNHDVADIALKEIQTNTQAAKEFVKWLCKINKHNILTNTTIKYDINDGTFKTPLGVIDKICLDKARALLDQIEPFIERKDFNNKQLTGLVNQYIRYIPRDLGSSNIKIQIKDIFRDKDSLEKELGIIDSLQASITTPVSVEQQNKVFSTKVYDITQDKEADNIRSIFVNSSINIRSIYSINIDSVYQGWINRGSKMNNIWRLLHATNPANALSILRSGLVIPKSYTNGWNHGPGIYFSKNPNKSLQYAYSVDGKKLMFVADVALGKYQNGGSISNTVDSVYVAGEYSEIIVNKTNQVNILYLVEF